ncbi:constitutive coactivator of PPAR-gamma-like protein 2 isoform X1 [Ornithorhynchus anatinus]|uniref:constitutive coactivator of PPAR-gamma-like protein 2 isoform X1 n=1 Tax=Ornithorhynchus anatinus TaxID=9258 RepID=UPI0010A93015|nr:constitutive coactivator of PPAR-gamma-like protein 2 isoform X1 [Ornithorhynchus anatinus]
MGVQGFQEFLEKRCPGAVVPVDLLKLARIVSRQHQAPPPPLPHHPHQQQQQQQPPHPAAVRGPGLAPQAGLGGPGQPGGYCCPPGSAGPPPHHHHHHHSPQPLGQGARVLVDAGSALPRLYGGYQTDWVCGGQWNAMLGYLAALCQACAYPGGGGGGGAGGLELVVMFPGGLGKDRLPEWGRRCQAERQTAQLIVGHVGNKGTPPPRAWFLPPACLSHCVRLALIRFRVKVFQSLEDHHLEVVAFFREHGFHGLLAHDSEYALCNIPSYYSSHALKLSWNGKNLTTNQFLMQEVAKQLGLKRINFPIFAALLGNHILPDEDLAAFHWSLLGPDHPLASLKVRAHQLVLPPCDVVIKAVSEYVSSIKDPSNLDRIGKDVFKQSQSRMEDKIERFKKAVEYYSVATKLRPLPMGPSPFLGYGPSQFGVPPLPRNQMGGVPGGKPMFPHQMPPKMQYPSSFPQGPNSAFLFSSQPLGEPPAFPDEPVLKGGSFANWSVTYDSSASKFSNHLTSKASPPSGLGSSPSSSSDGEEQNGGNANHITEALQHKPGWEDPSGDKGWVQPVSAGDSDANLGNAEPHIPSLLSMATRNHMDITTPPLPLVAPEVLRVAEHRHRRGLMYPYIYHVLTKGEIKIPVCIEDECNTELPPATILFRTARQYVYGVLFSLAETQRRLERLAIRRRIPVEVPPIILKEWSAYKGKSPQTPELVSALTFREWTCPNLKKLWLGKAVEDKNRRMRAFLACMKSDTPSMLNPANVPTHLLLMCCVLRYMIQWPGGRILHRHELDAFLAQAVSAQLYEPDQLQELKIEKLDARGIQLAALFMSGVDTALFANDACGQPVPWEHCCPWIYFDGKLFQSKLIKAGREKAPLIELCDGQTEQAAKVEKMRQSILEGINLNRQAPPPLLPPPPFVPPMVPPPFYPVPLYPRAVGSMPPPPPGRTRGFAGLHPIPPQGGKLEIAGMVVGQWAGSKPSRGRGSFGMQVVSVGGPGKGRGREMIGKVPKGNKKVSKQCCAEGAFKPGEFDNNRPPHSQVNGNSGTTGEEEGCGNSSPAPSQSALSRDSDVCNNNTPYFNALSGESDCCREKKLGTAALQKEE